MNLVFHHLADSGLHPVLGETGDPAVPATALLRAMGIEPGRNDETVTSAAVQDELAALRARYLGESRPAASAVDWRTPAPLRAAAIPRATRSAAPPARRPPGTGPCTARCAAPGR